MKILEFPEQKKDSKSFVGRGRQVRRGKEGKESETGCTYTQIRKNNVTWNPEDNAAMSLES